MRRTIFNSKILYIVNLIFNLILLLISVLSLNTLIFSKGLNFSKTDYFKEISLYIGYFIIYLFAVTVLIIKPKKTVFFLTVVYSLGILFNISDFVIHYFKYEDSRNIQILFIFLTIVGVLIFSFLIYFNNKRRFVINFRELEEIGTAD